ncbi:ABC transporter substrate-binding protein [bacterium]|nr:ABC transporter substrate-binding protein [candidate division CSSED10-310 bacterium]
MRRGQLVWLLAIGLAIGGITDIDPAEADGPVLHELTVPHCPYPALTDSSAGLRLSYLVERGLYMFDREGAFVPFLAARPEAISDEPQLEYVIEIKKDVHWPARDGQGSGRCITVDDVVFTYRALMDERSPILQKRLREKIKSVRPSGENKLTITLVSPDPFFRTLLSIPILPRDGFSEPYVTCGSRFFERPVGCGPFCVTGSNPAENLVNLVRNPCYPASGAFDEMSINTMPERSTAHQALLQDKIHFIPEAVSENEARHLKDSTRRSQMASDEPIILNTANYNTLKFTFFAFNCRREHFSHPGFRKALSYLANREYWVANFYPSAVIISGPFSPSNPYYNTKVQPLPYDPETARAILLDLGYEIREQDGKRSLYYSGMKVSEQKFVVPDRKNEFAANMICDDFRHTVASEIGLDIALVESTADADYEDRVFRRRDFDMAYGSWGFGDYTDISPLFASTDLGRPENMNFITYINPEIDDLFEQYRNAVDLEQAKAVYFAIHEKLADDCPYIFLWSQYNTAIWNATRLKDVDVWGSSVYGNIETWRWVQAQ